MKGAVVSLMAALVLWTEDPGLQFVHTATLGSFTAAAACIVAPRIGIVVFDPLAQTVTRWEDIHSSQLRIGGFGWAEESFDHPASGAFDGLTLYVADHGNHRVQRFDSGLRFLSSLSTHDTSDASRFGYPLDVAVSNQGSLFVLDGEEGRVLAFDRESKFERAFGNRGTEQQRLNQPLRMRFWSPDTLLVLEPHRCVAYDVFGNFLTDIRFSTAASLQTVTRDGEDLVVATRDSIYWCSFKGISRHGIPCSSLLADQPISNISDLAFQSDSMFLLSSNHLFVFRIIRN